MTQDEWLKRYKQRFKEVVALDPSVKDADAIADACANAVSFEDASQFFEDDPEGAADEEMSYWEA